MENSIKLALEHNAEDIAVTALKLQLDSVFAIDKIVVLVEGFTDKEFYAKIFNENVYLYKSEYGCGHFQCILDKLKKYEKRFIVLKDADFDIVNSVDYSKYTNLFITDYHDAEIMCAFLSNKTENILTTKLLNSYERGLFDNIAESISIISFIKWFNSRVDKKIGTKGLVSCYNANVELTLEQCLEKQNQKYGKSFDKNEVEKFISDNNSIDKKLITNGHDFCNALGKFITEKRIQLKKSGKRNYDKIGINEKCIQAELKDLFSIDYFTKTKMYKSILKWQISNNCLILSI